MTEPTQKTIERQGTRMEEALQKTDPNPDELIGPFTKLLVCIALDLNRIANSLEVLSQKDKV